MNVAEYQRMFEVEEHYWWYVGMRQIMLQTLKARAPNGLRELRILDAGCGTGGMLAKLGEPCYLVGVDKSPEAMRFSASRKLPNVRLVQSSITHIPLDDASFDAVISFDVLCSVPDDDTAIAEFFRVLKPGGFILIGLPAFEQLRSQHDTAVMIVHRYTAGTLTAKLRRVGFEIERVTYANTLLFPLAALVRILRRDDSKTPDQATSDLNPLPEAVNSLLCRVLQLEGWFLERTNLPIGLTVIALARK